MSEPGQFGSKGPITPARITVTFQTANRPEKDRPTVHTSPSRKYTKSKSQSDSEVFSNAGDTKYEDASIPLHEDKKENGDQKVDEPANAPTQTESLPLPSKQRDQEKTSQFEKTDKPPRGFAKRFIRKLGSRKERYQGNEASRLDPLPEDQEHHDAKPKRSLARKLLSRKGSKFSKKQTSVDVDELTFGGNQLNRNEGSVCASVEDDFSTAGFDAKDETQDADLDSPECVVPVNNPKLEVNDGDGSLASEEDDEIHVSPRSMESPLTREALEKVEGKSLHSDFSTSQGEQSAPSPSLKSFRGGNRTISSGRGSWLLESESQSFLDDELSSMLEVEDPDMSETEEVSEGEKAIGGMQGVYCNGRLSGFELIGEKGSKVPNLTIGKADVSATVFVKFVFEYDKDHGWRPGQKQEDRPQFHVEKLKYSIEGNNVPMPPTLIKHILRIAIPGLIQRRLLALLPPELGEYVQSARRGFTFDADVGLVGPSLAVLDADVGFEIRGPTKSEKEARKQQSRFEASKEARNLLGLNLSQGQILSEIFNGRNCLLSPPRLASISNFIALKAQYDAHPKLFKQLCSVIDATYQLIAQNFSKEDASNFSFLKFMEEPVARLRKKPARARVIVKNIDISVNADAVVTALHDFTQRAIEELTIKGPLTNPQATLEMMQEAIVDDLEVLHAWHVFALRELGHFKSKFKSAGGTVLLAADKGGVSIGIENSHYEGPLRLRLPVALPPDHDGAVSFDLPLPSPSGSLGVVRFS